MLGNPSLTLASLSYFVSHKGVRPCPSEISGKLWRMLTGPPDPLWWGRREQTSRSEETRWIILRANTTVFLIQSTWCVAGALWDILFWIKWNLIVSSHPAFPEYLCIIHSFQRGQQLSFHGFYPLGSLGCSGARGWELVDADGSHYSSVPMKHSRNTHVMPAWICVCFPALQYDKGPEHPPQTHLSECWTNMETP